MRASYLIKNTRIVNEGVQFFADVLIRDGLISQIGSNLEVPFKVQEINGENLMTLPGVIDDQVHFREPGLTHKGEIYTEARAAVAGGVTSYMEMPNVNPQTVTQALLEEKYVMGKQRSLANYSFYMGVTNQNSEEVLRTNPANVCGIKIFMGSSTGDMLVDDEKTLSHLFGNSPTLIAVHCEDEATIRRNMENAKARFGEAIPFDQHPLIRSAEACYLSSSFAVGLAKKNGTRLHILHISTGRETTLFSNDVPLVEKKITTEACIHHLWFSDEDYQEKGPWIKWNPAVKSTEDRRIIWEALLDNRIDVVATDHAPHTIQEKGNPYSSCPSGGPLIQHSLVAMLDFYHSRKLSLERVVEKMSHAPAICFQVEKRGFIKEGYWADLALIDLNAPWTVSRENVLAKCGWSPFEGHTFKSTVKHTFVSGHLAYSEGMFDESIKGQRLSFSRK